MLKKNQTISLAIFSLILFTPYCKRKEAPHITELRQFFTSAANQFEVESHHLDKTATPAEVKQSMLALEKVFSENIRAAKNLIQKYPQIMNERPTIQIILKEEMHTLQKSIQLVARKVAYWQEKLAKDKEFNTIKKRIENLNNGFEFDTKSKD
ncbi:MAG TPA: hypothetical protein PLY93_10545 [Turneriella sp.]|nr:hypothetical protein [Turneriella sp.]